MFSAPEEKEEELEQQEHFVRTKLRWIGDSPIQVSVQDDVQSDLESYHTAHSHFSEQEESEVQDNVDDSSSLFSLDLLDEDFFGYSQTRSESESKQRQEEAATSDSDDSISFSASKGRHSTKVSGVPLPVPSDSLCVPSVPFCAPISALRRRSVTFYTVLFRLAHFCS